MAAKTVMHDELTGVTLILKDDKTTELLTVRVNGHEVLIPEQQHSELYEVASRLQAMMRDVKSEYVAFVQSTEASLSHTQEYLEFNEAILKFTD